MELRDKVALVTGGASGLGRATALALAAEGVEVVVADLDEEGGRAVAEQVGGHFLACDVSDFDANVALVAAAVERRGRHRHRLSERRRSPAAARLARTSRWSGTGVRTGSTSTASSSARTPSSRR